MVSGHFELLRAEITKRILNKHDKLMGNEKLKVSPYYRTKKERRDQNKNLKKDKSKSGWYYNKGYSCVLKVDPTPGGELMKNVRKRLSKENLPKGRQIMVQESMGKSIRSLTSNSADPDPKGHCERQKCLMCQSSPGGSKGKCWISNITYSIECKTCWTNDKIKVIYHGETSRSGFSRGIEHIEDLEKCDNKSPLWEHCKESHNSLQLPRPT